MQYFNYLIDLNESKSNDRVSERFRHQKSEKKLNSMNHYINIVHKNGFLVITRPIKTIKC